MFIKDFLCILLNLCNEFLNIPILLYIFILLFLLVKYLPENNANCAACQPTNQYREGNSGFNAKSGFSGANHQALQQMPSKSFDGADENNMGIASNTNAPNNGPLTSSSMNPNNPNQQHQDFKLVDLNFDPAALIGGNGENTDLNVSL